MKLKLQNFKCYEKEEFDIPEKGLVLISAPSGSGKSTILEGIIFALFGTGKKLPSWGKKSCRVELEHKGMLIIRTKVPNHLSVRKGGSLFEDDSGQAVIDELFGAVFQTTSFVDNHNLHKSFILMSPTDKLVFLEKFALQEIDLADIKNRAKEKSKRLQQDLISSQSRLGTAEEILGGMEIPEKAEFPFRKTKSTPESKLIKNEEIRYKNAKILISRAERTAKDLGARLRTAEMSRLVLFQLESEILEISGKIIAAKKSMTSLEVNIPRHEEMEEALKLLVRNRGVVSLEKNIKDLEARIKESAAKEREELKKTIAGIKKAAPENPRELENLLGTLHQQKSKAENNEKLIKELAEYEDFSEKDLEDYREELTKVEEKIENRREILERLKLSKELLSCPSCRAFLTLEYEKDRVKPKLIQAPGAPPPPNSGAGAGADVDVDADVDADVDVAEKEIKDLGKNAQYLRKTIIEDSKKVSEKKILEEKLEESEKYFAGQGVERASPKKIQEEIETKTNLLNFTNNSLDKLQELESKFRNEKFSWAIDSMKKELEAEREKLEKLKEKKSGEVGGNEEEIREELMKEKLLIRERDILGARLGDMERELELKNARLKSAEKPEDIEALKESAAASEKELEGLRIRLGTHQENVEKIRRYEIYRKEMEKYAQVEDKVKTLAGEEAEAGKKFSAVSLLKQKILESESIAIHKVIDSINTYASNYLGLFFPDDPITVSLMCFKEAKNKKSEKPQINVRIIYKNEECDVASLSGGELSRLVLAFTLALGEMFNTPTLMLDECTASLDQVNTQNVFESIKQNFGGRLVLAIAHQVVEGSYDHVIKL